VGGEQRGTIAMQNRSDVKYEQSQPASSQDVAKPPLPTQAQQQPRRYENAPSEDINITQ